MDASSTTLTTTTTKIAQGKFFGACGSVFAALFHIYEVSGVESCTWLNVIVDVERLVIRLWCTYCRAGALNRLVESDKATNKRMNAPPPPVLHDRDNDNNTSHHRTAATAAVTAVEIAVTEPSSADFGMDSMHSGTPPPLNNNNNNNSSSYSMSTESSQHDKEEETTKTTAVE